MTGIKRTSPDSGVSTRPSKVSKTNNAKSTSKITKKGGKKGVKLKPSISDETFSSTASPLHVNLTHTPPTSAYSETEAQSVDTVDPGFIENVTLVPSTFSTGSFGWKGSKRITVELPSSKEDEKEEVQVMLTINATVVGSKPAPADEANNAIKEEKYNNESEEDS